MPITDFSRITLSSSCFCFLSHLLLSLSYFASLFPAKNTRGSHVRICTDILEMAYLYKPTCETVFNKSLSTSSHVVHCWPAILSPLAFCTKRCSGSTKQHWTTNKPQRRVWEEEEPGFPFPLSRTETWGWRRQRRRRRVGDARVL